MTTPLTPEENEAWEDEALARGFAAQRAEYVQGAIADNRLAAESYKHLPWPSLDGIVGGIAPGKLWYWPLYSGSGKTTILTSLCEALVQRGDRVYCVPMESTPKEWLRHLVCRHVGVDAGEIATGKTQSQPGWQLLRKQMNEVYLSMIDSRGLWDNLLISKIPDFSADAITAALLEAEDFGADWVIVDGPDHLAVVPKQNEYQVSFHGNKAMRDVGKDLGLRVMASSQLKDDIAKQNRLALHMLPSENAIAWGGHKRQLATGMIGGCWPLRFSGVSKEDLAAYRDRKLSRAQVCEPGMMCLGVMKHRDLGKFWGEHVFLEVEQGKVLDRVPQEFYRAQLEHGIRTGDRL